MVRGAAFRRALALAGLVTLAPVTGAAQASEGPDALTETYRDWMVVCRSIEEEGRPAARLCEMVQELRQAEGGQRVLRMALRPGEDGQAGFLTMITPFGLKVTEPVAIAIDEVAITELPFHTCLAVGCVVQGAISGETVTAMQRGESAVIALPTTGGGYLQTTVSLMGFTAAWNRLQGL